MPAQFGIGAKTRANDLDVAFQFSFFTGTSAGGTTTGFGEKTYAGALQANQLNIRQAYLTFGDASWGTIKLGRDLGIFASDAISNDMTLLGVGLAAPGGSSTLGRIGSGYIYADWKGQIAYTSPNWNGFSFTAGVTEPWSNGTTQDSTAVTKHETQENMGFEAKAGYDFSANDVTGRVWLSALSKKHEFENAAGVGQTGGYTSRGVDVGARVAYQGFTLVGYYYDGRGLDSQNSAAFDLTGTGGLQFLGGQKTKDSGGYVQATFVVPTIGTKLGASWGTNNSKAENGTDFDIENESWIIGAYHPLTKNLNLVAEYANHEKTDNRGVANGNIQKVENNSVSLGAILFF